MFTLSLPYSRSRIFHTKFFLGAAVLAGSQFVSYGVSDILFLALKPDAVHHFQSFSAGMLVISLMIYALVTAAGTITGNLAAQLITAFTVSVFPIVVMTIYLLNAEFLLAGRLCRILISLERISDLFHACRLHPYLMDVLHETRIVNLRNYGILFLSIRLCEFPENAE